MTNAIYWILVAGCASGTLIMADDIYRDFGAQKPLGHILSDFFILVMILLASVFAGLYFRLRMNMVGNEAAKPLALVNTGDQWKEWHLTPAEAEVATWIIRGLNFYQIADLLDKSERTVRQQAICIYAKAGVRNRSELTGFFIENLDNLRD